MSDDFEKAVLFTFDQSGNVSEDLRAQAQAFLQNTLQSPGAWNILISRFETSGYVEVKFWCLQSLHATVSSQTYSTLPSASKDQLKRSLVTSASVSPSSHLPSFIRNKIAQTLVAIAAQEYPDQWPTFFQDLLSTLNQGQEAIDLFCRILVSIDEDIISLDVPRSAQDAKQSMRFKDAMREGSLDDLAMAWCQVVAALKDSHPDTVAFLLDAVQRYVHWVDISLIANNTFVPLLFSVLNLPDEAPRTAAAGVLIEIVSKRMEAGPKIDLIQNLGVVPVCAEWAVTGLPGVRDEHEVAVKYSQLLATLATEVLEAWKKVENSMLSMAAVGLGVDTEAESEADSTAAAAAGLLSSLFPAVLTSLKTGDDEIATAMAPFLLSYIARARLLQKRAGGVVPPDAQCQLPAIQDAVASCARFADDSAAYHVAPSTSVEKVAAEEEEAAISARRQELFTLFRNTAKLVPQESYALVARRLEEVLSRPEAAPWQDTELALSLLYQLGEGATEESLKAGSGALASLATAALSANFPAAHYHRLTALALLETCARYAKTVQQTPELIPKAISLFLGPTGLGHPSESVPPRAAYLFCRFVKTLRHQAQRYAEGILRSLQPLLSAIATSPLSDGPAQWTGKAAGASSIRGALGTGVSSADDRLYAFEAAGVLIGSDSVDESSQLEWLWLVLHPLVLQLESNAALETGQQSASVLLIQQGLEGLTRTSKGFTLKLCTEHRPRVGLMLAEPLAPAMKAVAHFAGYKLLRTKFLAYLHRLVECLGSSMIHHLSQVLWTLQQSGDDAGDLGDILLLLNQMIMKFSKNNDMYALIHTVVGDCISRVHSFLNSEWDWSGVAALPAMASSPAAAGFRALGPAPVGSIEHLRERAELQKNYYTFLNCIATSNFGGIFLANNGDDALVNLVANDLIQGATTHADANVRKLCINTLSKLLTSWINLLDATNNAVHGNEQHHATNEMNHTSTIRNTATTPASPIAMGAGVASAASHLAGTNPISPRATTPPIIVRTALHDVASDAAALGDTNGMSSSSQERVPLSTTMTAFILREFCIQKYGGEVLLEGLAAPGSIIDVRDASSIALLNEIATQMKGLYKTYGQEYTSSIVNGALKRVGWPHAVQEQLIMHIAGSEAKVLKDFLKGALMQHRCRSE